MYHKNSKTTPYYIAIKKEATVHVAWTKYNPDAWVQADITREQVFEQFALLKDVTLFSDAKSAADDAEKKHYDALFKSKLKGTAGLYENLTLFLSSQSPTQKSSDKNLCNIYGDDCVHMQTKPITLIYQVEIPETLRQDSKLENSTIIKLSEKEKGNLKLEVAIVQGLAIHATDEYAKRHNVPASEYLINHQKLTAKQGCVIL